MNKVNDKSFCKYRVILKQPRGEGGKPPFKIRVRLKSVTEVTKKEPKQVGFFAKVWSLLNTPLPLTKAWNFLNKPLTLTKR